MKRVALAMLAASVSQSETVDAFPKPRSNAP